jgi:hypothetical protein
MKRKTVLGMMLFVLMVTQGQMGFATSSILVECLSNPNQRNYIYGEVSINGNYFYTLVGNKYSSGSHFWDKVENGSYTITVKSFKFNEWTGKWNEAFRETLRVEGNNDFINVSCSFDNNGKILNLKVAQKLPILSETILDHVEKRDAAGLSAILRNSSDDPINMRLNDGNTFLINEIKKSNVNIRNVQFLVEFGAKVNLRNELGETAASLAYEKGEIEVYNYLKANGAIDFEPRQAAQQPTTPATSSSIANVYVQPSAPAQSAPTPTPSTPAGWNLSVMAGSNNIGGTWNSSVGRGNFMILNGNGLNGTVNIQLNGKTMTGTASISGNYLNLYITSGELKGQQARYTIVTNKLIQGDGENFSRY